MLFIGRLMAAKATNWICLKYQNKGTTGFIATDALRSSMTGAVG